jgi:hypothetical protein
MILEILLNNLEIPQIIKEPSEGLNTLMNPH